MLVAFNLLLDDIVFPDGHTAMGTLGGGGPQAAFGMRLFAAEAGLVSVVGPDLPEPAWAWLNESRIDTAGVWVIEHSQTPRAWQITEEDGRRTQVWRVRPSQPLSVDLLPEPYRGAQGFHLGLHPDNPPLELCRALKRLGGIMSVELFRSAERPLHPEALFALLSAADVFSANLREAQSLVGAGSPRSVARRLVEAAESRAVLIVLRLGPEGSLVVEGQTGQVASIPAASVDVVDAVGAGNAYSGAFLAEWIRTRDLARAGLSGAVAASFAVEQVGLPIITDALRAEAQGRLNALELLVELTSL